jgi:NAD(P)H-flavin reductase
MALQGPFACAEILIRSSRHGGIDREIILRLTLCYGDYMHVTKRFGHIAASQFPFHYMLSMKSIYSPLAFAFGTSHEHLNTYHRISGRIIYCFLVLHATLYLNFFAQLGVLQTRLTHLVPFLGAFSITLLTLLASTSLESIRRWSYRVFFILHLSIAVSLMPILFFHAPPLRLYTMEALALFIIDTMIRKLDTVTVASKVTSVEHTNLVKLSGPIPSSKIGRFNVAPGQHVYLSIPPESVGSKLPLLSIYQLLYNPFTVADVSPKGILIVLRTLKGPTTTALNQLTGFPTGDSRINIEGPYGVSRRFPNFAAEFDRILLVAGGVGATFILPIYHRMISGMSNEGSNARRVELVWAMRSLAEASWVANTEYASIIDEDHRVKVYVTGVESGSLEAAGAAPEPEDGSVEMEELLQKEQSRKVIRGHTRPNLRKIVDGTFSHSLDERVAVLVCGPAEMARELRQNVGRWVTQGRNVWWHDESFGW